MADGVPTVAATLDPAAAPIEPAINLADRDPVAAVTDELNSNVPDPVVGPVVVKLDVTRDNATWEELGVARALTPSREPFIDIFNRSVPPWDKPTPVQATTIPSLLQGHDCIVQAPAGAGKTSAYLITALALLARSPGPGPHVVFLTPFSASPAVVENVFKRGIERLDSTVRVCRVRPEPNDMAEARSSPNGYADYAVLAASIGTLAALVAVNRTLLMNVKLFVADEADRLLHNHSTEFRRIVGKLSRDCQRTFWSTATIDDCTEKALREMTRNPRSTLVQRVDPSALLTRNCANYVVSVPSDDAEAKFKVMELIEQFAPFQQMLVFANKPKDADFIAGRLRAKGWSVDSMHGRNDGHERKRTLTKFRNKEVSVLIATDILARGLDCADLNCVVNWDLPRIHSSQPRAGSIDCDTYVQRVLRGGRMLGKTKAFSLVKAGSSDAADVATIAQHFAVEIKELEPTDSAFEAVFLKK